MFDATTISFVSIDVVDVIGDVYFHVFSSIQGVTQRANEDKGQRESWRNIASKVGIVLTGRKK